MSVCDQSSAVDSLTMNATNMVMPSVDAMAMLPVMENVAAAHHTAAMSHKNTSDRVLDLCADRSTTVKSVSNASGTLSKTAVFCLSKSVSDNAPLTRLASSICKLDIANMDLDCTLFSHGECLVGNGGECSETPKSKLMVNAALKVNENGSRFAVWGAH